MILTLPGSLLHSICSALILNHLFIHSGSAVFSSMAKLSYIFWYNPSSLTVKEARFSLTYLEAMAIESF